LANWDELCEGLNTACVTTVGQKLVTHVPQAGPEQELTAIVEDPIQIGDEAMPGVLMIVSATLGVFNTSPMRNDTIRIDSAEYRIFAKAEDSEGASGKMIHLSLTA
jgi:hypothetical protein